MEVCVCVLSHIRSEVVDFLSLVHTSCCTLGYWAGNTRQHSKIGITKSILQLHKG